MILILFIIGISSAFFVAVLEKEDYLIRNTKPAFLLHWLFLIISIAIYILYYNYWYSLILLISSGFIFTIISFVYLEVLGTRYKLNHFAVHMSMLLILTAISKITWSITIFVPMAFILSYLGFTFSLNKILDNSAKSTENVKQMLELIRILNGILLLIIGLIFATNRIPFLERIAQYLFN